MLILKTLAYPVSPHTEVYKDCDIKDTVISDNEIISTECYSEVHRDPV